MAKKENDFWRRGYCGTINIKEQMRKDEEYNKIQDFTWFQDRSLNQNTDRCLLLPNSAFEKHTRPRQQSTHSIHLFDLMSEIYFFFTCQIFFSADKIGFDFTLICNVSLMRMSSLLSAIFFFSSNDSSFHWTGTFN